MFQKESCIEVPATLAQHKSITSGQPCPPCQISCSSGGTSISPMKDLTRSCPTGQQISSTLTTQPLLIEKNDGLSYSVPTAPQGDAHIKYSHPIQACPLVGVQQKSTSILQSPCQKSSQINPGGSSHPLSSESPSLSCQQLAPGHLTNKQRRRNQRQLNMQHQLAQARSSHQQQHSVPVDNRRYGHGNPAQILKLQRPSSSSEPSLAGEVTGRDATTGSKVKFSFLSSPLHRNTTSPTLGDESLSTIQSLIQTSSPHVERKAQEELPPSQRKGQSVSDPQLMLQESLSHPTKHDDVISKHDDVISKCDGVTKSDSTKGAETITSSEQSSLKGSHILMPRTQCANVRTRESENIMTPPPQYSAEDDTSSINDICKPTPAPILDQDKCECKVVEVDTLHSEDSLTYNHETQILLPTSDPPTDPHNTREYIPTCFTPVPTLSQCTHDGRWYYDEHNDFGLEIPAGAIPEGESITIDIAVALYGPFQYPEGLRPVSPVFWVCVCDQKEFQFLKPIKVTIPHCLNLENCDNIESLGLTFLKADHEMNPQQIISCNKQREMYLLNLSRNTM